MSKRPTEVLGKKIVYRYSAPVVATIILSLLSIGCFVAALFLPYAGWTESFGVATSPTGISYFNHFIGLFASYRDQGVEAVNALFSQMIMPGNGIVSTAVLVWSYFMAFSLFLMGVFAFVLTIGVIVLIFKGHLEHWKLPYSMTKRIFLHSINYFGIIAIMNIFTSFIGPKINPGSTPIAALPSYFSYGLFGLLFVLTIVIHVIYCKAFKNRVYVKDEKALNEYVAEYERESVAVDTTTSEDVKNMVVAKKEDDTTTIIKKEDIKAEEAAVKKETPITKNTTALEKKDVKDADASSENLRVLPKGIKHIGGHAFSQNTKLEEANIPEGIDSLGAGAFANCVNLRTVYIPLSVKRIEYNCFFNCIRLEKISYGGTIDNWVKIKKGSNWLTSAGTQVVICRDGAIKVDPKKS